MNARVLVVDDEVTAREELAAAVRGAGAEVQTAGDGCEGLALATETRFDVCVTDIRMPRMDGIELLQQLQVASPKTLAIVLTAHGTLDTALTALRAGAVDYVLKPVLFEDLVHKVRQVLGRRDRETRSQNLRRRVQPPGGGTELVGESRALRDLEALIAKVGPTPSTVLITGQSGTGKELVARAIHRSSRVAKEPFVPFNCAAIPETMVESELFGHAKGAFTGAVEAKQGLLSSAADGSVFLDEVGDMPLAVQAKLLRALEAREVQPLGSVQRLPMTARIIAATNKRLIEEVEAGSFREDLYYRLSVVEIEVPALAERKSDLPLLIDHFVSLHSRRLQRSVEGVTERALEALLAHHWQGNVRELSNVLERGVVLAAGARIRHTDLPKALQSSPIQTLPDRDDLGSATRAFERRRIEDAVAACSGNKREAAKRLGLSLASLYRKS